MICWRALSAAGWRRQAEEGGTRRVYEKAADSTQRDGENENPVAGSASAYHHLTFKTTAEAATVLNP